MECAFSKFVGSVTLEGVAVILGGQCCCSEDMDIPENDLTETHDAQQVQM